MTAETLTSVTSIEDLPARRSPRAAAIAGLVFAVLFSVSVILIRLTLSGATAGGEVWLAERTGWFEFAIFLMPFAGIAFLWFIAVVRSLLGRFEDQFYATVMLGSGLIFLAMVFVAAGVAGGILASYTRNPVTFGGSTAYDFARDVVAQIFTIYAMRMAAVFVMSLATLWLRTKVVPRWLAFLSFAVALALLFALTRSMWVVLVFPAWVLLVSAYILIVTFTRRHTTAAGGATPNAREMAEQVSD
jgi:hypothetical protein